VSPLLDRPRAERDTSLELYIDKVRRREARRPELWGADGSYDAVGAPCWHRASAWAVATQLVVTTLGRCATSAQVHCKLVAWRSSSRTSWGARTSLWWEAAPAGGKVRSLYGGGSDDSGYDGGVHGDPSGTEAVRQLPAYAAEGDYPQAVVLLDCLRTATHGRLGGRCRGGGGLSPYVFKFAARVRRHKPIARWRD